MVLQALAVTVLMIALSPFLVWLRTMRGLAKLSCIGVCSQE